MSSCLMQLKETDVVGLLRDRDLYDAAMAFEASEREEARDHKERADLRAQEAYLRWADTATCADAKAARKAWDAERAEVRKKLRTTAKRKVRKLVRGRTERAKIG
jgi:hypothetical protein